MDEPTSFVHVVDALPPWMSGRGREFGPELFPVVGSQFAQREVGEVADQRDAVLRGKRLEVVRPGPHVAAVVVTEQAGHLCVVVTRQGQHLAVRLDADRFRCVHLASLICLDLNVK